LIFIKDKTSHDVIIWERWGKNDNIWGKNVRKVGKICQNEGMIGKRYQWK